MPSVQQIQQQRQQILADLAQLEQVRRGSLTEQMVETVGRDGRRHQRGPYPLYTFKEAGQTISRRLTDPAQLPLYRQQIQQGRRFQELTAQLLRLGEALSDQAVISAAEKKTSKPKSKSNSKPAGSSNG
jgi:hypothetical protein